MATANSLDELRRRIGHGAAPGAFAALAEEHRRAGRLAEAVAVCRDGLERYPTYVSARVTLGRALLDLGDIQGAVTELRHAVDQAPDNLAAARALETALALAPEPEPEAAAEAAEAPAEPSLMEWLAEPEDGTADEDTIVASFASEWQAPSLVDDTVAGQADAPAAPAMPAAGDEGAWAETIYAPVTPIDVWPDEAAPVAESSTAESLTDPTAGAWGASVDAAVAEVFARAAGEVEPTPAAPEADAGGVPTPLDTLQALLEAIRARRSALAASHSDVD